MNMSTKTRFVEYVARMGDIRNRSMFLVGKFERKGLLGRYGSRRRDIIKADFRESWKEGGSASLAEGKVKSWANFHKRNKIVV
jgi:hypothetical protein